MKYDLSVFQEPRGVMRIFQFVSIQLLINTVGGFKHYLIKCQLKWV